MHEFKERINEIVDLQRMHHEIIIKNDNDKVYNPSIIQTSLAALHKLNVTLSNYFDIVPAIGDTQRQMQLLPPPNSIIEDQARTMFKIEGCTCPMTATIQSDTTSTVIVFAFGVLKH